MKCNMKRHTVLAVSLITLLLLGAVGGTVAYLKAQTATVENVFQPAGVPSEVEESFNGSTKSNVVIRNNGNVSAYIRATIVVTWKNAQGNIYPVVPVMGDDYTITWTKDGWTDPDANGFYYHTNPVAADKTTGELFTNCAPVSGRAPEGYFLNVEILGQAIQAEGMGVTGAKEAFSKAAQ